MTVKQRSGNLVAGVVLLLSLAAFGRISDFPSGKVKWQGATITHKDETWWVKAPDGAGELRIFPCPKGKGYGDLFVISNDAESVFMDFDAAFNAGMARVMICAPIDLKAIAGDDAMIQSKWSGRGSEVNVLLEGADRDDRHWWRTGRAIVSPNPLVTRHVHTIPADLKSLHYRFDVCSPSDRRNPSPLRFHWAKAGPLSELETPPPRYPKAELLFRADFDGTADAVVAKGNAKPKVAKNLEFAEGRAGGSALRINRKNHAALAYELKGNCNPEFGAVSYWYRREWPETEHQGFPDGTSGRIGDHEFYRYLFAVPEYSKTTGAGNMYFWYWGANMRLDRGDLAGHMNGIRQVNAEKPELKDWCHFVICWDAFGERVYLNGRRVSGGIDFTGDSYSPQRHALAPVNLYEFDRSKADFRDFWIGCARGGGNEADGLIDDFSVWSAPLTDDEVAAMFDGLVDLSVTVDRYYATEGEPFSLRAKYLSPAGKSFGGVRAVIVDTNDQIVVTGPEVPAKGGEVTLKGALLAGDYRLVVSAAWGRKGALVKSQPLMVLTKGNAVSSAPLDEPGVVKEKRLLYTWKPTDPRSDANFRSVGSLAVKELGGMKYLECGPEMGSRFAVRMKFDLSIPLHLVEIDYPDNDYRTMDFVIQPCRGRADYHLQVGVATGLEFPLTNRILTHRCLYWTQAEDCAFVAMKASNDGAPVAVSEIRVYEVVDGRLPAAKMPSAVGDYLSARHFGSYWEDPAINYDFGCNHDTAASLSKLIDRKAALMKFCGQDTLVYPGSWYQGLIAVDRYNPRDHSRHFMQAWLEKFDREGLFFIPTINRQCVPFDHTLCTRQSMKDGSLHPTAIAMWDTGTPSWGGWHGQPPNFNILHPDVYRTFLSDFDSLIADGRDHQSFKGVCLHLTSITCPWWGSIKSGYNDYTIDAFEKATGIKVPVDRADPLRSKAYAEWLCANKYEEWVTWRCKVLTRFYVELAKKLADARPDLVLYVNAMPSGHSDTEQVGARPGNRQLRLLREAGIDPAMLKAAIPNLIFGSTLSPSAWRHRRNAVKGNPKAGVETYVDRPDWWEFYGAAGYTWQNLHDLYWENPIGKRKTGAVLSCDWLSETPWRVSTINASGANAMRYYALAVYEQDVFAISRGGFLIGVYGMEPLMARFAQQFRLLPAEKFETVSKKDGVAVRRLRKSGKIYHYVVNATDACVSASLDGETVTLSPYELRVLVR